MNRQEKLRRRRFLQIATAAASGAAVSCGGGSSPWRFFTVEEASTLEALVDQIIPADQDPGAAWAGVANYIDRQLMGHYKKLQPVYREGLAAIDAESVRASGRKFAELERARRTEFLEKLDAKHQRFFNLVVDHTMQGFYGDPRHGGNRDFVSWRMLGVPVLPIRGRQQYGAQS